MVGGGTVRYLTEPGLDTPVIGAVLTPLSSHVQPMQLAITIGEAAEQLGVQILENNTVLKIARDNTIVSSEPYIPNNDSGLLKL